MNGLDVFREYCKLKAHFGYGGYDYFQAKGRIKMKASSYDKRNDKYFFEKLARRRDWFDILLSNFVENENSYIIEFLEEEAWANFNNWKGRMSGLSYRYSQDLALFDDLESSLRPDNGQHPLILSKYLRKEIMIETLVILNKLLRYNKYWDRKIEEQYIWPRISHLILKYENFLKIDIKKFRKITKEHLKTQETLNGPV